MFQQHGTRPIDVQLTLNEMKSQSFALLPQTKHPLRLLSVMNSNKNKCCPLIVNCLYIFLIFCLDPYFKSVTYSEVNLNITKSHFSLKIYVNNYYYI